MFFRYRISGFGSSVILLQSAVVVTITASTQAQVAPPTVQQEVGPVDQRPTLNTQVLMQSNEGSLLQASQQDRAQSQEAPGGDKPTTFNNFYSVAPPEPHVLKKHDLVNIVVNEASRSQTAGTSDQERKSDFDAKVDAFVKFQLARFSLIGGAGGTNPPEVKLEGSRDFKGTGEYDRSDTMTTRLEAEVLDVKPNGSLVIQARRHLRIDEEEINVTLTGTCRVQDVDASNSVLSTDLFDLDLQKSTKGEVHDTTKRGLIHRLLDIVNPF